MNKLFLKVRATASVGFKADGVELNIWLVLYSRLRVALDRKMFRGVQFYRRNLWKFNLKPYSNVVVFGTEDMVGGTSLHKFLLLAAT